MSVDVCGLLRDLLRHRTKMKMTNITITAAKTAGIIIKSTLDEISSLDEWKIWSGSTDVVGSVGDDVVTDNVDDTVT